MKIKILILLLILSSVANGQTREATKHQFNYFGNPTYLSSSLDSFKQKNFILGWHWGDYQKISKALLMNQNDANLLI